MWKIKKVQPPPPAQLEIDCPAGQNPVQLTLFNSTSGLFEIVQFCWDTTISNCDNLNLIGATHTPNDWDAECNPL